MQIRLTVVNLDIVDAMDGGQEIEGHVDDTIDDETLSEETLKLLERQESRRVSDFQASKLEVEAARNWDLFYKRNSTHFFKDRHWTKREFHELVGDVENGKKRVLLEVGCGVGNFVFPLLEEEKEGEEGLFIFCCDFSARGVQFVKENKLYDEKRIKAFQCDITTPHLVNELGENSVDIVSCVFVLSAVHPNKHGTVLKNISSVLKPGGCLLFRDYGIGDMAMIRFGPGSKISDRFYKRQDGTRSYFFTKDEVASLAESAGLTLYQNSVVARRTVNKKEGVDVARVFLQAKMYKIAD